MRKKNGERERRTEEGRRVGDEREDDIEEAMSEKPLQVLTRVAEKRCCCFVDALSLFRRALMTSRPESASLEPVVF